VDFLCREARFVVEVDGATHSEDHEIAYDRRRDAYLRAEGYRIVRVLNDVIYKHINDVLDMILMGLEGKLSCMRHHRSASLRGPHPPFGHLLPREEAREKGE
jgi:very-short-patch-repair endonuclease